MGERMARFFESAFGPSNLVILPFLLLVFIIVWRAGYRIPRRVFWLWRRSRNFWVTWTGWLQQTLFPAGFLIWYLVIGATLTVFGFLVFIKLASELLEKELSGFDHIIGGWIISFRSIPLSSLMQIITNLGSIGWIAGIFIAANIFGLRLRKYLSVLAFDMAVLGAFGLSDVLKVAFQRPRPPLPWFTSARGYSFPSGHALISLTLYGFLAYLVFRSNHWSRLRYVLALILLLLPVMIGISRVYLGVHYPSDVLAGWAVAASWIGVCMAGVEFTEAKRQKSKS